MKTNQPSVIPIKHISLSSWSGYSNIIPNSTLFEEITALITSRMPDDLLESIQLICYYTKGPKYTDACDKAAEIMSIYKLY